MFEGKNIHFSPLDNKPLCSYSSKLCRQRRLNRYAFCIRHILEDKSAPFKQCSYVTRNNSQKCLNAIPSGEERGYCHSHMQVAGIIPKTERKVKAPSNKKLDTSVNGTATKKATQNEGTQSAANSAVTNGNAPVPKGRTSGVNSKSSSASKTKNNSKDSNKWTTGKVNGYQSPQNKKLQPLGDGKSFTNGVESSTQSASSTTASQNGTLPKGKNSKVSSSATGKKECGNKKLQASSGATQKDLAVQKNSTPSGFNLTCVRDRWKNFKFNRSPEDELKPNTEFEHLKTLTIMEKLPLFELPSTNDLSSEFTNSSSRENSGLCMYSNESSKLNDFESSTKNSLGIEILLVPPFLDWSKTKFPLRSKKLDKNENCYDVSKPETRQEFLARVRQAFKSQYKTLRRACQLNERNEKKNKAFRNSLLRCVINDPGYCAQVLVDGEKSQSTSVIDTPSVDPFISGSSDVPVKKKPVKKPPKKDTVAKVSVTKTPKPAAAKSTATSNASKSKSKAAAAASDQMKCIKSNVWLNGHTRIDEEMKPKPKGKKSASTPVNGTTTKAPRSTKARNKSNTSATKSIDDSFHTHNNEMASTSQYSPNGLSLNNININNNVPTKSKKKKTTSPIVNHNAVANSVLGYTGNVNKKRKMEHNLTFVSATASTALEAFDTLSEHLNGTVTTNGSCLPPNMYSGLSSNKNVNLNAHLIGCSLEDHALQQELNGATLASQLLSELPSMAHMESVMNSVSSSETNGTPDGVITDASFDDSPFDNSTSSHPPDCDFEDDDDLEKSFQLQLDPEIAHQASRLLEDNGLTEDDFNELFSETRIGDHKMGRSDLSDLGIDFAPTFDTGDIDYNLFANIFPNFSRSSQPESISVTNHF